MCFPVWGRPYFCPQSAARIHRQQRNHAVRCSGRGYGAGLCHFYNKGSRKPLNLWGTAGLILVLILGTTAAWLVAGRALQPLEELSDTIEEISGNDLSHRVEIRDRQDEIGRLVRSFNLMMDKVSASFERQKRFSASAAHELKTPLATIAVNLDVLALEEAPPAARLEKVLKVIRTNNERMIRLVDDLFRLTSENGSIVNEEVSLEELLAVSRGAFPADPGKASDGFHRKHAWLKADGQPRDAFPYGGQSVRKCGKIQQGRYNFHFSQKEAREK